MTKKPITDDSFDGSPLREAANGLTNGPIDQLHGVLKPTTRENPKGAREGCRRVLNMIEAAAVLRTVQDYVYMRSRRLQQIAPLMHLAAGAGNKPEYLVFCDSEGPDCDCAVVCKHKPKRLQTEDEKALASAERRRARFS